MHRSQKRVLGLIIFASLVVAFWLLHRRISLENANRVVGLAVDYNRVQELATMRGVSTVSALRMLRSAGATHVAVREDSVGDLISEEKLKFTPRGQGVFIEPAPGIRQRVLKLLPMRAPQARQEGSGLFLPDAAQLDLLRSVGIGYPEEAITNARAASLQVVARPIAEMTLTDAALQASMDAVQDAGSDLVVFYGTQVWGMYDRAQYVAAEMQRRGINFGFLEMAKQFGEDRLAAALKSRIIRCHGVAAAEQPKLSPQRALDRYGLAVRERNVRLCYIRPFDLCSPDPLNDAVQFVGTLAQELRRAGFVLGRPEPYPSKTVPAPALAVLLMGVGAGAIWVLQLIWVLPSRVFWGLVIADVALSLAAPFAAFGVAQSLGALASAIIFPVLAFTRLPLPEPGSRALLRSGIKLFLGVTAVSLAGGVLAAACLSDLPHMMQVAAFRGVKLAQVAPLLAVLVLFVSRCSGSYHAVRTEMGPRLPEWPALRAGVVEAASAVVRYWHVGLLVVAMAAAALMLLRSGNVSPVPPSQLELAVRSWLDKALLVRPRTKEILIGHPVLILSLSLLAAGYRRGLWAGMVAGAVGQVSLVNTFCHIHTPLVTSLLRVGNGIWIGIAMAIVYALVRRVALRFATCPILDAQGKVRAP